MNKILEFDAISEEMSATYNKSYDSSMFLQDSYITFKNELKDLILSAKEFIRANDKNVTVFFNQSDLAVLYVDTITVILKLVATIKDICYQEQNCGFKLDNIFPNAHAINIQIDNTDKYLSFHIKTIHPVYCSIIPTITDYHVDTWYSCMGIIDSIQTPTLLQENNAIIALFKNIFMNKWANVPSYSQINFNIHHFIDFFLQFFRNIFDLYLNIANDNDRFLYHVIIIELLKLDQLYIRYPKLSEYIQDFIRDQRHDRDSFTQLETELCKYISTLNSEHRYTTFIDMVSTINFNVQYNLNEYGRSKLDPVILSLCPVHEYYNMLRYTLSYSFLSSSDFKQIVMLLTYCKYNIKFFVDHGNDTTDIEQMFLSISIKSVDDYYKIDLCELASIYEQITSTNKTVSGSLDNIFGAEFDITNIEDNVLGVSDFSDFSYNHRNVFNMATNIFMRSELFVPHLFCHLLRKYYIINEEDNTVSIPYNGYRLFFMASLLCFISENNLEKIFEYNNSIEFLTVYNFYTSKYFQDFIKTVVIPNCENYFLPKDFNFAANDVFKNSFKLAFESKLQEKHICNDNFIPRLINELIDRSYVRSKN